MKKNNIKIGILNVQSGIGTTRGYYQYLFHLHKYFRPHNSKKIEKIGKVVREKDIDILATAEIDRGSRRTRYADQVDILSKKSGLLNYEFFSALKVGTLINQGNALHSSHPIINTEKHILSGKGEPRIVGKSDIEISGKTISFLVTHLSLESPYRKKQIKELATIINKLNNPVVLAGDFNIRHQGELDLLEESKLQKVFSGKTFPSWKPTKRLDYIFASRSIKINEGLVLPDRFSDHRLLMVDLEL